MKNTKGKLKYFKYLGYLFAVMMPGSFVLPAQAKSLKALFIGNSYTAVNDLPLLISNLALSAGDQLIYSSSMPGGTTFEQHTTNATTLSLLAQGGWDYVVLQEQSQLPAFPDAQVKQYVYPYARKLDSLVKVYSPCAKTIFYMTWGRKNGDAANCAAFPPVCTYTGMDSLLQLRYTIMADSNNTLLCPVAKVWRRLRTTQPGIDLYDADESHPSPAGSYAAACAFYATIFQKNPALCTYAASLSSSDAITLKNAAKQVVFDSLAAWSRFYPLPAAQYNFAVTGRSVAFTNASANAAGYQWYFGDGDSSVLASPVHQYRQGGTYQARLIARRCTDADTIIKTVKVSTTGITTASQGVTAGFTLSPNPAGRTLQVSAAFNIRQGLVTDPAGRIFINSGVVNARSCYAGYQPATTRHLLRKATIGRGIAELCFSEVVNGVYSSAFDQVNSAGRKNFAPGDIAISWPLFFLRRLRLCKHPARTKIYLSLVVTIAAYCMCKHT